MAERSAAAPHKRALSGPEETTLVGDSPDLPSKKLLTPRAAPSRTVPMMKRVAPRPRAEPGDVYVNRNADFSGQLARIKTLLADSK